MTLFPNLPLLFLFSATEVAALRSSAQAPMEPDEALRISELKDKGISIEPRFLGCRIVQSDPLPRMTFTISVHGDIIDTEFEDIERNAKCYV
ncbi:hypothetical protein FOZ63_025591 [Perkinsus olseni]|uniref:Uncharacterized protein n=2 Tax=Perkinsus olseni TaxID=32597 RepID=A0A7J6SIM0_PEROL|nr:hypothetical protein FOZ63_025591 [Perkinsus olseni]